MSVPYLQIGAAVAQGASGLLGNIGSKKRAKRQQKHNLEIAQYTFDKNLEMWQLNNKYNSPAEQQKRLQEGGLNPNLVYGKGSIGNTSGAIPQFSQETTKQPNMLEGLGGTVQGMLMAAQIKSIQKTTELTEEQRRTAQYNADLLGLELGYRPTERGSKTKTVTVNGVKMGTREAMQKLKVTEQKLANTVSSVKATLADKHGIIATGSNIATAILSAMAHSGISLKKAISVVINKFK